MGEFGGAGFAAPAGDGVDDVFTGGSGSEDLPDAGLEQRWGFLLGDDPPHDDGDVAEVVRLTTHTCTDPWVKFPYGNGRHNAKGQAETRELELPDHLEPPYREIAGILGDYMDIWTDICPQPG